MKKIIATSKEITAIGDKVLALSQELNEIIEQRHCIDASKVNINGLGYALFMYDMEFYRQVMTLKYSKFYIETSIRAIFNSMETNMRNAGNQIPKNYLFENFVQIQKALGEAVDAGRKDGTNDDFLSAAMLLYYRELQLTLEETHIFKNMILEIAEHFEDIINLPIEDI